MYNGYDFSGYNFMTHGNYTHAGMKAYLKAHVDKFKYGSIDTDQWKTFFLEYFEKEVLCQSTAVEHPRL